MFNDVAHELSLVAPALFPLFLFDTARFENQRWIKARIRGFKGSSLLVGFLVDMTGFLAMVFYWSFLFSVGYDHGVSAALIIFAALMILGLVYTPLSTLIFKGDNIFFWMVSTIIIYPLMFFIAPHVSWFGLFPTTG